MMIKVRFAPSPTGMLHIGGARTALFNYLFAKHNKGEFLLRIEDTDKARSTPEAVDAIFESLNWLGLKHDGAVVFQSKCIERHQEVAHKLLEQGRAYYCYCSPEELTKMREDARANHQTPKYNGMWRDRDPKLAPEGVKPVIRLKAPQDGKTTITDLVQGDVSVQNDILDDMILLRADGTPTYMLSVVVDDHDMGITHIIRGDDHLNNAFRQYHLYQACGWDVPKFAHIPLIHGPDGAKLSKRHGAVGTDAYKDMGFLPETMRNYLLRLGWGHGDAEIISDAQAVEWFTLEGVGKSAARFDDIKLKNLNAHYIKNADPSYLLENIRPLLKGLTPMAETLIIKGMPGLQARAKTLIDLAWGAEIYMHKPDLEDAAKDQITDETRLWVTRYIDFLSTQEDFAEDVLMDKTRDLANQYEAKLGVVASALRIALTGRTVSPSLFEVMSIIGQNETLSRLRDF
ncbi:MAG TPA: glutamate--tRNA ligase [Holosporales bacterium]|nr:glutamate--tRNA ligase [Holosporales bacterium]